MERNPFLARRLARMVGVDSTGLSYKVGAAQAEALRSIRPCSGGGGFVDDLGAEDGPKVLADLMEALIGAVALDVGGFDEAERAFAHIVVPPPEVMAAVAKGEVVVPGNSFGFEGKPFDTPPESKPGAKSAEFVQPFSF